MEPVSSAGYGTVIRERIWSGNECAGSARRDILECPLKVDRHRGIERGIAEGIKTERADARSPVRPSRVEAKYARVRLSRRNLQCQANSALDNLLGLHPLNKFLPSDRNSIVLLSPTAAPNQSTLGNVTVTQVVAGGAPYFKLNPCIFDFHFHVKFFIFTSGIISQSTPSQDLWYTLVMLIHFHAQPALGH